MLNIRKNSLAPWTHYDLSADVESLLETIGLPASDSSTWNGKEVIRYQIADQQAEEELLNDQDSCDGENTTFYPGAAVCGWCPEIRKIFWWHEYNGIGTRTYSPSGLYAEYYFDGDFKSAARDLRSKGFGL